jgi:hypothetical protein
MHETLLLLVFLVRNSIKLKVQSLLEHKKKIFAAIQLPVHALARPGATIVAEMPLRCVYFQW